MDAFMEIAAAAFKARCLQLMDEVARTREPIVITKRGRPVARLLPVEDAKASTPLWGYMAGTVEAVGDLVDVPSEEWALLSGEESQIGVAQSPAQSELTPASHPAQAKKR